MPSKGGCDSTTPMYALLVGNNYASVPSITLHGCWSDCDKIAQTLCRHQHVARDHVRLLRDATQSQFQGAVRDFVALARSLPGPGTFFFHYSGHGTQTPTSDSRETDGLDEDIVMLDDRKKTYALVSDDWLHDNLVAPFAALAPRVRLVMFFDCCHSGTVCDLDASVARPEANVFCWSACQDAQVATETQPTGGVFTDSLCRTLLAAPLDEQTMTVDAAKELVERQLRPYNQLLNVVANGPATKVRVCDMVAKR